MSQILGAFSLVRNYFNPATPPEVPSEQEINALIENKKFDEAEALIKKIPDLAKRALLNDNLNEARARFHFDEEKLDQASVAACKIVAPSMKDLVLEKIVNAYLNKNNFKEALTAADSIRNFSEEMKKRVIDQAIEKNEFEQAFRGVCKLGSESARKPYFDSLATQIKEHTREFADLLRASISHYSLEDTLLEEVFTILFEKDFLESAQVIAGRFGDGNKRCDFNEKIFRRFLDEGKLPEAKKTLENFNRGDKLDELRALFIDKAIGTGNLDALSLAAYMAIEIHSEETRTRCFDLLVPKMVNHMETVFTLHFLDTGRLYCKSALNDLLGRVIPILIERKDFQLAKTLVEGISPEVDEGIKAKYNLTISILKAQQSESEK